MFRAEHAGLAEDVAEPGPALGGHSGELLLDDRPDIGLGPVGPRPELGRHRVCAEEGRHDVDRAFAPEPVRDLDEADLGLEVQPVARFRLDRRDAVAEHLVEPSPAVGHQRVGGRGAGRGDRREDPAARREDLEIAGATLAEQQLALARAREHEVGVRVHETRRHRASRGHRAGRTAPSGYPSASSAVSTSVLAPTADDPAFPAGDDRSGRVRRGRRRPRPTDAADLSLRRSAANAAGHRDDLAGPDHEQTGRRFLASAALDHAGTGPRSPRGRTGPGRLESEFEHLHHREVAQLEGTRPQRPDGVRPGRRARRRLGRRPRGTRPAARAR